MMRHGFLKYKRVGPETAPVTGCTITAASTSAAHVQAAHDNAGLTTGGTLCIPAGSDSWPAGSVNITKAITVKGAGIGLTNINVSDTSCLTVTKSALGIIRFKDISFAAINFATADHPILCNGSWLSAEPIIWQTCAFTMQTAAMMDIRVAGGVIFADCTISGYWNDFLITMKDVGSTDSWTTADSMGMNDTLGKRNVYMDHCTIHGCSNGVIDVDDNGRFVMRYCTLTNSGGYNSHGEDSSPYGARHFEIYENAFLFDGASLENPEGGGNSYLANINQYIWIRGGTGVIFNNAFDRLYSSNWGDKPEIRYAIRGAEDDRPQGACGSVSYPVPHQLGQSNNGSSDVTDPIHIWNNTAPSGVVAGFSLGAAGGWVDWAGAGANPCGFDWNTFFQWGRDAVNTSLGTPSTPSAGNYGAKFEMVGAGTAKPGYTAFTYPHPLI